MSDYTDKLWIQPNLNAIAQNRASDAIQSTGRALPCTVVNVLGPIVTVKFECQIPFTSPDGSSSGFYTLPNLTLPKAESQWLRSPTQVGDNGMTVPADTFLGGVSGLGSGTAQFGTDYGNMSTLVFVPVGNKNWSTAPSTNKPWVNGPQGFVASDTGQTVGIVGDTTAQSVTIYAGEQTIVVTADPSITSTVVSGSGDLKTIIDGAGNAISHVVPSGGLIGLGALASSLPTTAAGLTNADLSTFQNSLLTSRLNDLIALVGVLKNVGTMTPSQEAAALATLVAGFLPAISVPSGSSIVRLAGG